MNIDTADAHFRSSRFPAELDLFHAATHIGLFVAWLAYQHLLSESREVRSGDMLTRLRLRDVTPRELLTHEFDLRLEADDLNAEGLRFASWYFDAGGVHRDGAGGFYSDYERALAAGLPSQYHVEDSWASYDVLAPVIMRRYIDWSRHGPKRWWQFWR